MSIADKLTTISENVAKVYEAGKAAGSDRHYDLFWDAYQENGNRTIYKGAFAGSGWTNELLKPKYDIQPTHAERMFASVCNVGGDLDEILGVTLDFSKCTNMAYTFYQFAPTADSSGGVVTLGIIDLSAATDVTSVFNGVGIEGIKSLIPPKIAMSNTCFQSGLKEVRVDGEWVANVNMSRCTALTHESLMSIIGALHDYAESGTTYTLTLGATNLAKLTDAEKLMATQKGWTLA